MHQRVHFQQRIEVVVAGPQVKHPGAAIAKQGLQHDLAVLLPEGADLPGVEAQQGRRHQLLEMQHEELFRGVAHRGRIVDDERPVIGQQLEQMRRRDVGHVEGRVLAHQHDVEPGQIEFLELAEAVVIAVLAEHFERPAAGVEAAVAQGQGLR